MLAGAVNIDVIAIVCKNNSGKIRVKSKGHGINEINISELEPKENEKGHSTAILRGVAARIRELGYNIGSFDAFTVSKVPAGSGLSSSAASRKRWPKRLSRWPCQCNRGRPLGCLSRRRRVYLGQPCVSRS